MKTHQIPIAAFTSALRMCGEEDVDDDESACIIANLIYESRIKVCARLETAIMYFQKFW